MAPLDVLVEVDLGGEGDWALRAGEPLSLGLRAANRPGPGTGAGLGSKAGVTAGARAGWFWCSTVLFTRFCFELFLFHLWRLWRKREDKY